MGKKVVHLEFPAQDLERSKKFWEGVGGWEIKDSGMPGMQYLMWQDEDQGGGIYSMEGMSGTVVYLGTEDLDGDLAKVRELGGDRAVRLGAQGLLEQIAAVDAASERERFHAEVGQSVEDWLAAWRAGAIPRDGATLSRAYFAALLERP
jgi:predicted enzyme related to lactoylglutathione lyase